MSSKNVTLGVPRLREIINVAATVKTPSLLVHLQPSVGKDADAAKTVLNKLEFTTLANVTERTEIYYDPTPEQTCVEEDREFMSFYFEIPDDDFSMENASPWMLRFVLDRKKKENKDLSNAEIAEKINMDWNGDLKCFPSTQTRVLTDTGFLFLDEIQRRLASGERVLYACYAPSTRLAQKKAEDVMKGQLLYYEGDLFFPNDPPQTLIEVSSAQEQRRWAEGSGAYGTGLGSVKVDVEAGDDVSEDDDGVSLLVTPDHDMYAQMGNLDCASQFVPACMRPGYKEGKPIPPALTLAPSKMPASSLLEAPHQRACARLLACASLGHTPAPESSTQAVMAVRAALLLTTDARFDAFLQVFGFWLGDGSLLYPRGGHPGAVSFAQVKDDDIHFLDQWLPKTSLSAADVRRSEYKLRRADGQVKDIVTWNIIDSRWFKVFDDEFGIAYKWSLHYDPQAAVARQGNARRSASSSVTPPSLTRSLRSSSVSSTSAPSSSRTSSSSEAEPMKEEDGPPMKQEDSPSSEEEPDDNPPDEEEPLDPDLPTKSAKWLPQWAVMHLSPQQLRLLISGLYHADGSFQGKLNVIHTSGVAFRDQLMQALLHSGLHCLAAADAPRWRRPWLPLA